MTIMPSPPMSVLKAYLSAQGYNVSIIYWNIILKKLEKEFIWGTYTNNKTIEFQDLLLLNNYLAIKHNDKEAYSRVKSALIAISVILLHTRQFSYSLICVIYDLFFREYRKVITKPSVFDFD